jgi:hypothetical protein
VADWHVIASDDLADTNPWWRVDQEKELDAVVEETLEEFLARHARGSLVRPASGWTQADKGRVPEKRWTKGESSPYRHEPEETYNKPAPRLPAPRHEIVVEMLVEPLSDTELDLMKRLVRDQVTARVYPEQPCPECTTPVEEWEREMDTLEIRQAIRRVTTRATTEFTSSGLPIGVTFIRPKQE